MGIRDVLQGLADPRALILGYFKSHGWEAGRFDYHSPTATLYLTVQMHGQPRFIPVPLGRTFTAAQLAELISQGDLQELLDQASQPRPSFSTRKEKTKDVADPHGSASPTIVDHCPP